MGNNSIKAIIFDVWYTLGFKPISPTTELFTHFNIEKNEGNIKKMEYAVQIQEVTDYDSLAKNLLEKFEQPVTKENINFLVNIYKKGIEGAKLYEGMKDLLKSLKKNYKLGVLSNSHPLETVVIERWGIDPLFDVKIYSWEIKALKPDIKAFEVISIKLGIPFEECLFIDDSKVNIEAAKSYKMNVLRFKDVDTLKIKLSDFGIKL